MNSDRFLIDNYNKDKLDKKSYQQPFWPPAPEYKVALMSLTCSVENSISDDIINELTKLGLLIHEDWKLCIGSSGANDYELINREEIAESFRKISKLNSDIQVKRALEIRADAIQNGYTKDRLKELSNINENLSLIAGKISTWSSKYVGGLPSAFASIKDFNADLIIAEARSYITSCKEYVYQLHKHLLISELPVFTPGNLIFTAGEANTHPKHIAYFLPGDEGIESSPYQKTYYFVNTHRKILESVSLPLAEKFLKLDDNLQQNLFDFDTIQILGVFAHEIGHFVHIKERNFSAITEKNKWISHVIQETAADVFGILFVAEIFALRFNISQGTVIYYYLSECLRYVDRGLGKFSDSDGMFLQLNYFLQLGALSIDPKTGQLSGNTDYVIAGLRSLARVLADTLLDSNIERTESLYNKFGPSQQALLFPLIKQLGSEPPKSIEYIQ